MIQAKVIADSISDNNIRLTTLSLVYPRFILAELNTHRMLSRNSASSRAIPTPKLLEIIQKEAAQPIHWGKNKPGMQAENELDLLDKVCAVSQWHAAKIDAIRHAMELHKLGAHKQVVNRIIEPFMHAHTIVSGTDWGNFFLLRRHKDAQPEIHALATAMHDAMKQSLPTYKAQGQWHLPYADDDNEILSRSVARCCRVSYMNHEGKPTTAEQDLALANKLKESGHWSPFEHQAVPLPGDWYSNNFRGWKQLRRIIQDEPGYSFR